MYIGCSMRKCNLELTYLVREQDFLHNEPKFKVLFKFDKISTATS